MKLRPLCVFALAAALAGPATAQNFIDFDFDTNSDPIKAKDLFSNVDRLTTLYAPWGVTFSGPGGRDGGAIVNQRGNFGVTALSGRNFLAFNRGATLSGGGTPTDPGTISFDFDVDTVSIFASGGFARTSFLMEAFDAGKNLIASDIDSSPAADWVQLSVAAIGIRSIRLTENGGDNVFVYDNLAFNVPVPEPQTYAMLLLGLGAMMLAVRRRPR